MCRVIASLPNDTYATTPRQKNKMEKPSCSRLRFSARDDIVLLREVLAVNPFEDSSRWQVIENAMICQTGKGFSLRSLREHLQLILKLWSREDRQNLRKSGTEEEFQEKEQLLQAVTDLQREVQPQVRNSQVDRNLGIAARDAAAAAIPVTVLEVDEQEVDEQPLPAPIQADEVPPSTPRKRSSILKTNGLQFLQEKIDRDRELEIKRIKMEEKKLEIEEMKMSIEKERMELEREKWEEEKIEKKKRLEFELKEKETKLKSDQQKDKLITLMIEKFFQEK